MPTTIGTSTSQYATAYGSESRVLVASDGTAFVLYYDGTNPGYRSAASPYSSWSSFTALGSSILHGSTAFLNSDDSIDVIYKAPSTQNPTHQRLTKSGSTWSTGTAHTIASINAGTTREAPHLLNDAQGRLWAFVSSFTTSTQWNAYYSTDSGATWTASLAGGTIDANDNFQDDFVVFVTGNYLVELYSINGGGIKWRRLDTSGTLTAWTTEQTSTGNAIWYSYHMSALADGNGLGMLVSSPASSTDYAIRTLYYTPGTDTWSANTDIGTGTSDVSPMLVKVGSDLYCLWSQNNAANNYSIVYKKWTAATKVWDSSATVLEGSGSNRLWVNTSWGDNLLAWVWTEGTASPWNVQFDSTAMVVAPTVVAGLRKPQAYQLLAPKRPYSGQTYRGLRLQAFNALALPPLVPVSAVAIALVGESDGVSTAGAGAALATSLAGSETANSTSSATTGLAEAVAGSATSGSTASGSLSLTEALASTPASLTVVSATAAEAVALTASETAVSSLSSAASEATALAAVETSVSAVTGSAVFSLALAGASTAGSGLTATATIAEALASSPASLATLSATAAEAVALAANSRAVSGAGANLQVLTGLQVAGTSSGVATSSGNLGLAEALVGAATGVSGASDTVSLAVALQGASVGYSAASDTASLALALAVSSPALSVVSGNLQALSGTQLAASETSLSSASAGLSEAVALGAGQVALSGVSAAPGQAVALTAGSASSSTVSGAASFTLTLAGAVVAGGTETGNVLVAVGLGAALSSSTTASPTLGLATRLIANSVSAATASANLLAPLPLSSALTAGSTVRAQPSVSLALLAGLAVTSSASGTPSSLLLGLQGLVAISSYVLLNTVYRDVTLTLGVPASRWQTRLSDSRWKVGLPDSRWKDKPAGT